jgi:hypothetical protein
LVAFVELETPSSGGRDSSTDREQEGVVVETSTTTGRQRGVTTRRATAAWAACVSCRARTSGGRAYIIPRETNRRDRRV